MTVTIQIIATNERIEHDFDDCASAVRFMSHLLMIPIETIQRNLRCNPTLRSFTAGRPGLFVRIAPTKGK